MSSNFPNGFASGVTIRGIPLQQAYPGEVFWVNSTTVLPKGGVGASNNNDGSYLRPFSTITYALTRCTASRGDIIMVMPGYTETVAAAAGEVWNVAGVAIIGLGCGALKPTITLSATGSDIDVTAANMSVSNFRFVSSVANLVHCLHVTGTNFTVDNCEFMASAATTAILTSIITTAAAYGLHVENTTINNESSIAGVAVTDVAASGIETLADNTVIKNCNILGNYSVACIYNQTTAAEGLIITDNNLYNVSTSAAAGAVSLDSSCSGMIYRNHATVLETSAITGLFINGNCGMSENYAVNVVTETAGLVHAAST